MATPPIPLEDCIAMWILGREKAVENAADIGQEAANLGYHPRAEVLGLCKSYELCCTKAGEFLENPSLDYETGRRYFDRLEQTLADDYATEYLESWWQLAESVQDERTRTDLQNATTSTLTLLDIARDGALAIRNALNLALFEPTENEAREGFRARLDQVEPGTGHVNRREEVE
jgi:hypothetical protein